MKCDTTKCNAWCCKGFFVPIGKVDKEMERYLEYHNCRIAAGRLIIPIPCEHLDENNKCKIYYSRLRPKMCRENFCHDSLSLEEEALKLKKVKK